MFITFSTTATCSRVMLDKFLKNFQVLTDVDSTLLTRKPFTNCRLTYFSTRMLTNHVIPH